MTIKGYFICKRSDAFNRLEENSMYTIIQYSPTGNTAYLAEKLASKLGADGIYALEHTDYRSVKSCEHLILMYPVHAFNAPKIVKEYVKNLPDGIAQEVSLIAVGCNESWNNEGTTSEPKKLFMKKGCKIGVEKVVAMPLTIVMSFPEEMVEMQLAAAERVMEELAFNIKEGNILSLKGTLKTKVIKAIGTIEPAAARMFGLELHAQKSCIKCKLCVKDCPTKNIRMTSKEKIKFGFNCSMCMRCIYQCPAKSISPYISKFLPIKGGYDIKDHIPL